jgi:hypothetical protein
MKSMHLHVCINCKKNNESDLLLSSCVLRLQTTEHAASNDINYYTVDYLYQQV